MSLFREVFRLTSDPVDSTSNNVFNQAAAHSWGWLPRLSYSTLSPHPLARSAENLRALLGHSGCLVSHLAARAPAACQLVCRLLFLFSCQNHTPESGMSQEPYELRHQTMLILSVCHQPGPQMALANPEPLADHFQNRYYEIYLFHKVR